MKIIELQKHLTDERRLPWLGASMGALVAVWMILQAHGTINNDGLLYIKMAQLFDAGAWREGLSLFNWPLYPLLMALANKVSGLGFHGSANLLAILFFAAASGGLMVLVREVGGDRRVMLAAGALLFTSPYMVGKILPMVVRDHGFWAMHLWSIVFFVRFYRGGAWIDAIGWGITAILAILFRIEGIAYMVMLPMVLLMHNGSPWIRRFASFAKANILLMLVSAGGLVAFVLNPSLQLKNLGRLGDPATVAQEAINQLSHGLGNKSQLIAEKVLGNFLDGYAMPGLLLTLILVILIKGASSAGWLQLFFGMYQRKYCGGSSFPKYSQIFGWLILLGLANAAFILLSKFLLPKRYVLPIAFVILVYAAFGLAAMHEKCKRMPKPAGNWMFLAAMAALAVQFGLMSFSWTPQKGYELDAVRWVATHAPQSRVYYDSNRLRYYAGVSFQTTGGNEAYIEKVLNADKMLKYDYMLIHVSSKRPDQQSLLSARLGTPQAVFDNGYGNSVQVFRVPR